MQLAKAGIVTAVTKAAAKARANAEQLYKTTIAESEAQAAVQAQAAAEKAAQAEKIRAEARQKQKSIY